MKFNIVKHEGIYNQVLCSFFIQGGNFRNVYEGFPDTLLPEFVPDLVMSQKISHIVSGAFVDW
jgi:hypothetical protein